ncbi:RES family NAD+ phosphorylase [Kocuria massiliensis]|uniref:RES family NAD+ phosphorylase n=1 Tax=Kocuria massiliensis TaxID=1926282 RepID=UPI0022B9CC5B|nr:RES family NAD+ phosphorylase [Kocuria massiliensis]
MNRHLSTLKPPGAPELYVDFPARKITAATTWWRVHRSHHSPWWFSSTPGRFNLHAPHGTLNLAQSPSTAAREALGPRLVGSRAIPAVDVADMRVTPLALNPAVVADLAAQTAPQFGIVLADITAPMHDAYKLTRAWAEAFRQAGFGGLTSRSRFAAGSHNACLYLFGPAGEHPVGDTPEAARELTRILTEELGLAVDPLPKDRDLNIDP